MSNILKIPFDKIRDEGQFKEVFQALERGFTKFGIDFYLVGATARDVWMKGVHLSIISSLTIVACIISGILFH